jgi:hypothetical protein
MISILHSILACKNQAVLYPSLQYQELVPHNEDNADTGMIVSVSGHLIHGRRMKSEILPRQFQTPKAELTSRQTIVHVEAGMMRLV